MRGGFRGGRTGNVSRSQHRLSGGESARSGGGRMEHWRYLQYEKDDKPQVSWRLIKRILGYARPYRVQLGLMLFTILASSLIEAANPLLFRQLIDTALPNQDGGLLDRLALGIVAIPLVSAGIGILQQYLSSTVGEG